MDHAPLKIDLDQIIRSRISKKRSKWLPRWATRMLEKIVCQDELNAILRTCHPSTGSEFAEKVYQHLRLQLDVEGLENIPAEGRFIFASNHPLGGLDGIGLIKVLGKHYGDDNIRFLVNDMLMNVKPLDNVFLPINKFGAQGRSASKLIAEAYESPSTQIIIFPAGLVSRLGQNGEIADLTWQKSFVQKAIEYNRTIIPIKFEGLNRMRFYRIAKLRKRLGLKINIEQALLPSELCAARGNHFKIKFGTPIFPDSLIKWRDEGKTPLQIAQIIKNVL